MDRLELTRLIRFGLADLSARNAHHSFEEMCRFLVAERITSNVYPATGPVSGGGDGGRDFQTFVTYIRDELGPHGGFAALASASPVAFACTLQAKGLPSKVRRDLKKIAGGPAVQQVYALLAADLNAAKVADLKREAEDDHQISLEVIDGQAIAELLSQPDTFWIAARWLAVPAEYAPTRDETAGEPEWYAESRDRWRMAETAPMTMGELMDVRAGLRRATFHRHARPDLGMWLTRMGRATESDRPEHVRQRARYETAVAQLRGAGDLRPADGHVVTFLKQLDTAEGSWAELMDASVLLQYAVGAAIRGRTTLQAEWIGATNAELRAAVEKRLRHKGLTLTSKAGLLNVLGQLRLHTDLSEADIPDETAPAYDPIDYGEGEEWRPTPAPPGVRFIDADGAIAAWTKLARLAPKAPLAPVESVSQMLSILAPALVDRPGYRNLVALIDQQVAGVAGDSAAAQRSRDRALSFLRQDQPLDALTDLHEAKVRWWRGDTLRGSMLVLLLLARCYERLGLHLASRQQALIAVGLAHAHGDDDDGDLMAAGLMQVAHADYHSGAWCAAAESYGVAIMAHVLHQDDPWDAERHEDLAATYVHGACMLAAARSADARLAKRIEAIQREVDILEVIEPTVESGPDRSAAEWRTDTVDQMGVVPFADAGPDRAIKWQALGIKWIVTAVNNYTHSRAAERLAAAAQVLCGEMAQEDLVLLPTTIRIRVQGLPSTRTANRERVRSRPSNDGSDWLVDLEPVSGDGANLDPEEVAKELLTTLTVIFYDTSLVGWTQHREMMKRCFERGLAHKLSAGRPYDDLAGVVTRARFEETGRTNVRVPEEWRDYPVPDAPDVLAWRHGPGPGYTPKKSEAMIRNRYRRTQELIPYTISRLAEDSAFAETYAELVRCGWKDWHVLLALVNTRINFRARVEERSIEEWTEILRKQPQHPSEDADEPPLPAELLTVDRLDEMRLMAFITGLTNWDLEVHQDTPDLPAIDQVLKFRYGYWTDDIPHPRIFGGTRVARSSEQDAEE